VIWRRPAGDAKVTLPLPPSCDCWFADSERWALCHHRLIFEFQQWVDIRRGAGNAVV